MIGYTDVYLSDFLSTNAVPYVHISVCGWGAGGHRQGPNQPNVNSRRQVLTSQKYTTNYTILKDSPSEVFFSIAWRILDVVGTGLYFPPQICRKEESIKFFAALPILLKDDFEE